MDTITVNPPNLWRLDTSGHAGWERTARPRDPGKHFIVSADEHVSSPWATASMGGLTDGQRARPRRQRRAPLQVHRAAGRGLAQA